MSSPVLRERRRGRRRRRAAPLDAVVHGRPVHFVDGDEAAAAGPGRARGYRPSISASRHVVFQFEPIAAALDYERQCRRGMALIADIGGGTSDFSIVRLGPERHCSAAEGRHLANDGIRVGGTDFDRHFSLGAVMPLLGYRSAMKRPALTLPPLFPRSCDMVEDQLPLCAADAGPRSAPGASGIGAARSSSTG